MMNSKPSDESKQLQCFVIGPIGKEHSEPRLDADWLLQAIVVPVLESPPFKYQVIRADKMPTPGTISLQIISAILDSDLIVADLTHHNPNAFYELAIAHLTEKKTIHLVKRGHENLPFDLHDMRAIVYSRDHPDDLDRAKAELRAQMDVVSSPSYKPFSPIANAQVLRQALKSSNPDEKVLPVVIDMLSRLSDRIASLEQSRSQGRRSLAEVLLEREQSPFNVIPVSSSGILPSTGMAAGILSGLGDARMPINAPSGHSARSIADLLTMSSGDLAHESTLSSGPAIKSKPGSESGK